jgi:hypothetical protein
MCREEIDDRCKAVSCSTAAWMRPQVPGRIRGFRPALSRETKPRPSADGLPEGGPGITIATEIHAILDPGVDRIEDGKHHDIGDAMNLFGRVVDAVEHLAAKLDDAAVQSVMA